MMRSVSTFWRISGAATPVTLVNFSIYLPPVVSTEASRSEAQWRDLLETTCSLMLTQGPSASLRSGRRMEAPRHDLKLPHIGDGALDRRRRGHRRAGEMGARAGPLAADEIAVGGRHAALPRRHPLAI